MEDILLCNSCIAFAVFGESVGVELCHCTFYPNVLGESLETVKAVQKRTVCDLASYSADLHKLCLCIGIIGASYTFDADLTRVELFSGIKDIFSTKAASERCKIL